MNVVFVGGGSFRTLPIVRGALQDPAVIGGGEIRLVDFNLPRVETVARLIMRTPECVRSGCKVTWTDRLEKALPGARTSSASVFPSAPKGPGLSLTRLAAHDHDPQQPAES